MEDWKQDQEMDRLAQFHSLPVEAMVKVKSPKNLYPFCWESDTTSETDEIEWDKFDDEYII